MNKIILIKADVLEGLKTLPDEQVQMVCTSPPYWGLRDYGTPGQFGLEKTPEEYITKMVEVFREVRRVLRKDGTLWLNMGDSYAGSWGNYAPGGIKGKQRGQTEEGKRWDRPAYEDTKRLPLTASVPGLKPKDLCGIPWRLALALQADGWWLRSDIIWHKPNPMPESVTDRPTTAHEHIFLLTKSAKYYYDAEAVREEQTGTAHSKGKKLHPPIEDAGVGHRDWHKYTPGHILPNGRNLRSVWTLATEPFPEAHFATFPTSIPERCIKAGTSEKGCCPRCGAPWVRVVEKIRTFESGSGKSGNPILGKNGPHCQGGGDTGDIRKGPCLSTTTTGWRPTCSCPDPQPPVPCLCLDPFSGTGTTALVAAKLGRDAIGIELNPQYIEMSRKRLLRELGMLAKIEVLAGICLTSGGFRAMMGLPR